LKLSEISKISRNVAVEFGLPLIEIDTTNHTLNVRLIVDHNIFITIYANDIKDKLNLALIFYGQRLFGHDKEGGRYHVHPFQNPDEHHVTDRVP